MNDATTNKGNTMNSIKAIIAILVSIIVRPILNLLVVKPLAGQLGPVKKISRAIVKMNEDGRCWDIARGQIICTSLDEVYETIGHIFSVAKVIRIKDRFSAPLSSGYRDILINISIFGVKCEVQVHLNSVLKVKKEVGHKIYVAVREGRMNEVEADKVTNPLYLKAIK